MQGSARHDLFKIHKALVHLIISNPYAQAGIFFGERVTEGRFNS